MARTTSCGETSRQLYESPSVEQFSISPRDVLLLSADTTTLELTQQYKQKEDLNYDNYEW